MPSLPALPGRLGCEDLLIGSRSMVGPTTVATCSTHKLLAAATAAPGGGSSRSDLYVIRLWREEGEQEFQRPLKVIAPIRDCVGPFHRLAWSRGGASSNYSLGLIAGGLDRGTVCIWDVSSLMYQPQFDYTEEILNGTVISWFYGDDSSSSCSLHHIMYDMDGKPKSLTVEEEQEMKFKERDEKVAAVMRLELDDLIEKHVSRKRPGDSDDEWQIIQKELISNRMLLKLNHLSGPVLGLAFNCQYANMLACAGYGEKLSIYYLDHPDEFASRGRESLHTQMTFLEWHPLHPAILASTCDIGDTKLWDLREPSSKSTFKQDPKLQLSCSEVHWNPSDPLMFAVVSKVKCDSPVQIWDVRNNHVALYAFGNAEGVASLTWSRSGFIATTDVEGVIDYWRPDENNLAESFSSLSSGFHEARCCQSDGALAAVSSHSLEVYRMPPGQCVWRKKDDPLPD